MTNFFDKLKKGMDIENIPPESEESELKPKPEPEPQPKADPPLTEKPEKTKPKIKFEEPPKSKKKPTKKPKKTGKIEIKHEPILQKYAIDEQEDNIFEKEGQLTVDVFETEKDIIIQSAVAGVEPKDLDITIEKDIISIKGKRERKFEEKAENFFYQECHWGRFSREIVLPAEVEKSKAEAIIKDGVLTIKIPKKF